jgi:hypothetical protein
MNQVKPYQFEEDKVYKTGGSKYLEADRVQRGEVVRITHIGGSFENIATTEYVELGYWNGHAYVPLYKGKPPETGDYVHWKSNLWLREGQYVYAYFADVANDEKMKLRAEGRYE